MRRVVIAALAGAGLLVSNGAHAGFEDSWSVSATGNPDGLVLADVDGDGKKEIAVVLNGAVYDSYPVSEGTGGLRLLNSTGQTLWTVEVDGDLNGYPNAADLDGDGLDEIVFCETSEAAMCHLVDGDGSILWSQGPYFWPSLWTMGPEIADVDNDGALEVVFPSYGGKIVSLDGATGAIEFEYDAWNDHDELFYSRVRLGNIDADPALEAVVFGSLHGYVVAVDGATGGLDLLSTSLWEDYGNYAYATGPTLADLDGDGTDEIVINGLGDIGNSATLAMEGNGNLMWRTVVDGELYWTSAAVGDANGDLTPEIYVQDVQGELSQLDTSGNITQQQSVGTDSWMEPLLVDVSGDLVPEVLAAQWDEMLFHNGSLNVNESHSQAGSGWWWPVIDDIDNDGYHEMIVTAWTSQEVYMLEHPSAPPGGGVFPSGHLPIDLLSLFHAAQALADDPGTSSSAEDAFEDMSESWWEAVEESVTDDDEDVWELVQTAMEELLDEGNPNDPAIATWLEQFRQFAMANVQLTIDRAEAVKGNDSDVVAAKGQLGNAESAMANGNWSQAVQYLFNAIDAIDGPDWEVDNCPVSPTHPEMGFQCTLMALATEVEQAAPTMKKAKDSLLDAVDGIRESVKQIAEGDAEDVPKGAMDAEEKLKDARTKRGADKNYIDEVRAELAATIALVVKRAVGDAERVHGASDEDYIELYDAFKQGEANRAAGKYKDAYDDYIEALDYVD